ncbi:AAA family ATPase [Aneurinibacillus terranovensis]|uniref:AAA family ATPase n=1 Tax=Aneurinibacillus terranovensis TaxID=278991 RepID=UPI00042319BF|nr:AAA family ATPase [Aneurinibacillus terranovensis]
MRIEKIELFNFRQFYGKQEIFFAGHGDNDNQMVTVIYGKNGRGKTGLYRAVMFCLYGDRILDQDYNYERNDRTDDQNIYLVNTFALNEDAESEHKGVEAYVKIQFRHRNKSYEMLRSLYAIQQSNGEILQEERSVKLTFTEPGEGTKVWGALDKEKIELELSSILDNRVKNYFLFDGERIERLTKVTQAQKKDVAEGIKNLLKIDELYKAEKTLQLLNTKLTRELSRVSTGEYKKKLNEKEGLEEAIDSLKEKINIKENEIERAQNQVKLLDQELEKYKESQDLILQRKEKEKQKNRLQEQKDGILQELRRSTAVSSVMLARDVLNELYVDIDEKRSKGEVPSEIKKELIEKLLAEMSCICGRPISLNSEEYEKIQAWNRKTSSQVFEQYVMELYGDITRTIEHVENNSNVLFEHLQRLGNVEEEHDMVAHQLERLQEQLNDIPDSDIAGKNQERIEVLKKIGNLEKDIESLRMELDTSEKNLEEVKRDVEKLSKESDIHNDLQQKLNAVIKSCDSMKKIINGFVKDVRVELEKEANENFKQLLDEDGQKTLKRIVVNDDYTLEVLDWQNRKFLANISAGQRQVVSLSFITALAQVAGGSHVLEIPLFMDTPFGRLSGEHRDNLLKVIPDITPQWVLLVTDEEFGKDEANVLKHSNKWSKLYVLEAVNSGVTQIKEVPVEYFDSIVLV